RAGGQGGMPHRPPARGERAIPVLGMRSSPAVLAIDGGNSKTDVALVADDGSVLASARGPGINAHEVGVDQTTLILDAVVKQAASPGSSPSARSRATGAAATAWASRSCGTRCAPRMAAARTRRWPGT